MGELQLGLLSIGVLVIVGVFFYNKWQERRYQREAEAAFASRHEDVLMRSGGEGPRAEWQGSGRVEPMLASAGPAPEASKQTLSEFVDFIVPIETSEEVPGASMLDAAGAALEHCPRSVHLEGFDEARSSWELIDPDRSYSKMRAGLQLVDRRGAADEEELALFGAAIEGAAASLDVLATVPDPGAALARAKDLDRFCGEIDIRIAVHLVNDRIPFPGAQVSALAAACVFVGGGLGACLRWLLSLALNPLSHIVPLGTLAANLIGGYLIGVRMIGIDANAASQRQDYDPSDVAPSGAFMSAFMRYLHNDLNYQSDLQYYMGGHAGSWDYTGSTPGFGGGFPSTSESLRLALAKDPYLHVLVGAGYYDMATPFANAEYTFTHLGYDQTYKDRVKFSYYESGHMAYLNQASAKQLKNDITAFILANGHPMAAK